jgi:phthalate 4,5-dioxygenase reductase subunit
MSLHPEHDLKPLRLISRRPLSSDIHQFTFVSPDGGSLSPFSAGSHIRIRVPNGLVRSYSLCNAPEQTDRYVIAVKREAAGRGGSASLVDDAKVGDELAVSEPQNAFPMTVKPGGYLFIAGGIGITPLLSMSRHLLAMDETNFRLVYLSRNRETTAFVDELSDEAFGRKVTIHYDEGDPSKSFDLWTLLEKPKGQVYCCGPRGLMDAVRDMTGHWSTTAVHFEDFGGAGAAPRADDKAFDVRLARSGRTIKVPADATILETLRAEGVYVPCSCESGTCGSCKVAVVEGQVDHRDLALTDEERGNSILVCVSRAQGDELVLDL